MVKNLDNENTNSTSTNAGFVSYILLGIIAFIISMGLLFLFIK